MSDLIERQAAIDIFGDVGEYTIFCKNAKSLIRQLPSVHAEPCGDCISREAVLDTLVWYENGNKLDAKETIALIQRLPSVHAEPRTGHWIFEKGDGDTCVDGYICSVCKTSYHTQVPYFAEYKYCPNCGARMEASHE